MSLVTIIFIVLILVAFGGSFGGWYGARGRNWGFGGGGLLLLILIVLLVSGRL